jgi:hypothetical protein
MSGSGSAVASAGPAPEYRAESLQVLFGEDVL